MASPRLGRSFAQCALGGVNYAAQCFQASRVPEGLSQLASESLRDGLQRGIFEAARRVGVPSTEIARVLPMRDLEALIARIDHSQRGAGQAWQMHAGQLGGLLQGIAELTVDGRAPDAALCLERLAKKVARDRELAEPLGSLAIDVAAWEGLVQRCRGLLDDGGALERAYRQRRTKRIVMAVSAAVMVGAVGAVLVQMWRWRAEVRTALEAPDPCVASALTERQLQRAGDELRAEAELKRAACDEQKRVAEAARAEEAKKQAYLASCEALAKGVEERSLGASDDAFAAEHAAVLRRIANGALSADDFGPIDPVLPCADTPSHARLLKAFDAAIPTSEATWLLGEPLAPRVQKALVAFGSALHDADRAELDRRAEEHAKRAIVSGEPGLVAKAARLCQLHADLGGLPHGSCSGILAIRNRP